ncbi:hypothetical protein HX001_06005 [Empedobacter brevis]|uniref:Uncharacterized protein n=1 Tax=Empedobacter brevis TaxID=247 RepID=A0AAJ1V7L1_9FLAO|nr:hypothetical protein [Empedobacter brevis]MDM1072047.1 hypothetical protein [Empedobacter brevis]
MIGYLIKFTDIFPDEEMPKNPLDLIKHIPKEELLVTLSSINSLLNPIVSSYFDDSMENQHKCLKKVFYNTNIKALSTELYRKYIDIIIFFNKNASIFSRMTCLFAIQDIVDSDGFIKTTPYYTSEIRFNILKYILCVNNILLDSDKVYNEAGYEEFRGKFFEFFMFKELPKNQYYNSFNSINYFYKSIYLLKCIENEEKFGLEFQKYILEKYGIESLNDFVKNIIYAYFKSYDKKLNINYLNIEKNRTELIKFFDSFSERANNQSDSQSDLSYLDFLSVKKGPLYKSIIKDESDIISYLILDTDFFIGKMYDLLINDFWFDYLKPKRICNRTDWGSFIGNNFFEPFLTDLFEKSFKNNKRIIFRHTDDLKFTLDGKNQVEYADFYIRQKNKVILVEAKSNYLPLINGYKTVLTKDDYLKIDLDKFYKDYGVTQLACKTIKDFHSYKHKIKDYEFKVDEKVELFPTLVVNDHIFSSGYSSMAFKKKFEELLLNEGIEIENQNHKIYPLTIINVNELLTISKSLEYGLENIFNIFRHYHSSTSIDMIIKTKNTNLGLLTIKETINKLIKKNLIVNKNFDWLFN